MKISTESSQDSAKVMSVAVPCDFCEKITTELSKVILVVRSLFFDFLKTFQTFYSYLTQLLNVSQRSENISIEFVEASRFEVKIQTQRLCMYPSKLSELAEYTSLQQDPEVVAFDGDGQVLTEERVLNRFRLNKFEEGSPLGLYSVFQKEGKNFVGFFNLLPWSNKRPEEMTAGLVLHKRVHGQGFGSEVARAISKYILSLREKGYLNQFKVMITAAHPDNIASWKIQEKMGMQYVGLGTAYLRDNPSVSFTCKKYRLMFPETN